MGCAICAWTACQAAEARRCHLEHTPMRWSRRTSLRLVRQLLLRSGLCQHGVASPAVRMAPKNVRMALAEGISCGVG